MERVILVGTRDSQLATWQATQVQQLLAASQHHAELVYIKSEGDINLKTPLYEMGVQGIFTKILDIALLEHRIDIAVHSMKDVPTQLPAGIQQAAVLKRGPVNDLLVYKTDASFMNNERYNANIATSSIRRKAQWLHKFPKHHLHNLRGNVNTRLKKLAIENWDAAIFAQAGLERINVRPENSFVIDWMIPAPAQGAIIIVCRKEDEEIFKICNSFNDVNTALCTAIERDFLRELLGGCSTPIGALAEISNDLVTFKGNIFSTDGKQKAEVEKRMPVNEANDLGKIAACELLRAGGQEIVNSIRNAAN